MVTVARVAVWVTFLALVTGFCIHQLPTYVREMALRRRAAVGVTCYTDTRSNAKRDAVWCNNAARTLWLDSYGEPLGETAPAHTAVRLDAALWGRVPDADELSGASVTVTTPATPQPGDISRIDIRWADGTCHRLYTPAGKTGGR